MSADPDDSERKANVRDVNNARSAIKKINFADAISESTRKYRRTLYALSGLAFVLSDNAINVTQIPWLAIPAPDDGSELVRTLILVALVYQWISFLVYGLVDLIKWESNVSGEAFQVHSQLLFRIDKHLNTLTQTIEERSMRDKGVDLESVRAMQSRALRMADDALDQYELFAGRARRLTVFKRLMAWSWEFGLPLFVGVWTGVLLTKELLR